MLVLTLVAGCASAPDLDGPEIQPFPTLEPVELAAAPPGMTLWLKADRGAVRDLGDGVVQWIDQSGAGNHVVQTDGSRTPRYDAVGLAGRPSLHFDGNDYLDSFTGMPAGSYTKVAVVSLESLGYANNIVSGHGTHALWYGFSDRATLWHNGASFAWSGASTLLDTPTVIMATYDAVAEEGNVYIDGAWAGSGTASPHGADTAIQIGGFAWGNHFQGHIAEVMVFDRVLPEVQRDTVHAYLQSRYLDGPASPVADLDGLPRSGQVLARGDDDRCVVEVSGTALAGDNARLDVRRGGLPLASDTVPLTPGAGFTLTAALDAGLYDHRIEVTVGGAGGIRRVAVRDNVTCGDLLLLQGQSNTVAGDYWGEGLGNNHQSHWVRSFGTASLWDTDVPFDLQWSMADGEGFNAHATIGQWGLRMGELLVEEHGIPLGILNGAVGGTEIALHQRDLFDPESLFTIYGRTLYRARQAGIDQDIRAVLWYQGESDSDLWIPYYTYYLDAFATLRSSWLADFPAIENIWVFQVRRGCGLANTASREHLRTLPDIHPDVSVMSTTNAPGHDGCHFTYSGYEELGVRLERVVSRDLYGAAPEADLDPPNPASAAWGSPAQDTLVITYRDPDDTLVWAAGVESDFELSDGTGVTAGEVVGNTVVLHLAGPSAATTVSYVGHEYDAPFLATALGVGALTFFDLPIDPP